MSTVATVIDNARVSERILSLLGPKRESAIPYINFIQQPSSLALRHEMYPNECVNETVRLVLASVHYDH
jgi:hypothetical protein